MSSLQVWRRTRAARRMRHSPASSCARAVWVCALALGSLSSACGPSRGTIGAVLVQREGGRLYLREVPPKLGAARAGLRPGDELLLIDGHDVRGLTEEQLHGLLSGKVGETVQLTVSRGSELLRVVVERRAVPRRSPPAPSHTAPPSAADAVPAHENDGGEGPPSSE